MSIVQLESESVISRVVESMLPRFSDSKLGLLIGIDMHLWDSGYGADGNTLERKEKNVRPFLYFLFVRPSNYTKVFFWQPKKDLKGLDCYPYYNNLIQDWNLECDHDSCWRDSFGSKMTDIYFACCEKFEGRKRTGKELRPCDLSTFITFTNDPMYVHLEVYEQINKTAERSSKESRAWKIKMQQTSLSKLEVIESPDSKWMATSGLLIKGSDDHKRYMESVKNYKAVQERNK